MSKQLNPGDFSALEQRAAEFVADAELWDNRLLGADEEFVEVCSDAEVFSAAREITQEREKQKKDLIVLGAGPRAVGTLTGAIIASLQKEFGGTYFDMELIPSRLISLPTSITIKASSAKEKAITSSRRGKRNDRP